MSKTIREVLEKLYRISATTEAYNNLGEYKFNGLDDALADISRLLEEAKPRIWRNTELRLDDEWVGYVNGVENYTANLERIKG